MKLQPVMSLWNKPRQWALSANFNDGCRIHVADTRFLNMWKLSIALAEEHYGPVKLVCDRDAAKLLCSDLGLKFRGGVDTCLDQELASVDPRLWSLGKVVAYSKQTEPFIHLDNDVFLWNKLPEYIENAALFAQSSEKFRKYTHKIFDYVYPIDEMLKHIPKLPDSFREEASRVIWHPMNAGIFGGNDIAHIHGYCKEVLDTARCRENEWAWRNATDNFKNVAAIILEQWMFGAYLMKNNLSVETLIPLNRYPYEMIVSRKEFGYSHLAGDAKANPVSHEIVAEEVRKRNL